MMGNFLKSLVTISFSKATQFHGISVHLLMNTLKYEVIINSI
jgi:hypothetical protein